MCVNTTKHMIADARQKVAQTVNAELTLLYWHIGRRIRRDILKKKRAAYGDEILQALSAKLTVEFGRGFSQRNLASMVRFAETFPNAKIVSALRRQLSWSHFIQIIYLDDPLKRDFYTEMCRIEGWSTRTLEKKIQSMLFERPALSRKPEKLAELELKTLREEDKLTPDLIFRDPYLLDFLGLKDAYVERDLEAAILREMEAWDQEYVNMEVPGHFTFQKDGSGHSQFGLVQGEMDCRLDNTGGNARIAFSWEGQEELDPASGRGWAVIEDEELKGRLFFHQGDDSAFRARRS